jgi:AcrR family transcriptional regulator
VTDDDTPRVAKLRQGRAHRTRQALRDAAASLWTERGYDAVAVSEICDHAGVSKGTFFYYFPTKEHLLLEVAAGGGTEALAVTVDRRLQEGATVLEVIGGALLIFGLLTPIVAAFVVAEQVMVIAWLKWQNGLWKVADGIEYPVALAALALILVVFGAGRTGVDMLFRRGKKSATTSSVYDSHPA